MKVATAAAVLAFVATGGGQTPVEARKLVCFGNEPSWSVRFDGPGQARVGLPNVPPADYLGRETRNEPLKESVWRGNAQGTSGDLVLLLRDAPCSDGMSDATHPVIARASLPDGSFLAGCCRVPGAQVEAAPLEGSWRLVSLPGQASTTLAALTRPVSLRFEAGRVTGFTGCNTVTGIYTLKGNAITFGRLASTMMACPEPASSVERTLTEALRGTLPHTVTADRLSLTAASGAVDFERAPPPALEGRSWTVTGYNNGRQAVVTPIADSRLALSFENGTISGQAGCNTFRATYSTQGNRITIGAAATTRKMCSDALMAQERDFLKALESATRWTVDGALLNMHRADDQRALTARPSDAR